MQRQFGDMSYFHRFVRRFATLQSLLLLALVLGASSATTVVTESPGDIVMHGIAALIRIVSAWLKSIPSAA